MESELWEADAEARNRIGVANVFHLVCRHTNLTIQRCRAECRGVRYKWHVRVSFMHILYLNEMEVGTTYLLHENACAEGKGDERGKREDGWLRSMAKAGRHVGRWSGYNLEARG